MAEAERVLIAAKDGDLSTLRAHRRLIPLATDSFGASTLHYAARSGQLDCLKWLCQAIGEDAKSKRTKTGASAVHDAAAQGHLECVKFLVQKCEIPVDIRDTSGHTPLHLAARFGRAEVVKWLLHEGHSEPRVRSRNHMTPVHFAASGGSDICLGLLLSEAGYSAVNDVAADGTLATFLAAQDGNLKCLKYLHSIGGKCNVKTRDGILPIHGAAQNGHLDCLIFLVESGQASWADRDSMGATPAHYAASQGHVKILQWLRTKGSISSVDNLGGTPLHDAAEQGEFECIRYLVEIARLDVLQPDNFNATPVDLADRHSHRKCRDFLKIAASKQVKQLRKKTENGKKAQRGIDGWQDLNTRRQTNAASHERSFKTPSSSEVEYSAANLQKTSTKTRVFFDESSFGMGRMQNQKTHNRRPQVPEERHTEFSISDVGERLGDFQVPSSSSQTTTASAGSTRPHKATRELGGNSRPQTDAPIPRPWSSCDVMMSQLRSGQTVGLQHVLPPPAQFSEGDRDKTAEMFGVDPVVWKSMPQWKRQVYISRRQKDEEARKRRQLEEEEELKKWDGIPFWRISLIQRKERDKLTEEQKWAGVPEWKKNLLLHRQNSGRT